jgi:hypothetical protein
VEDLDGEVLAGLTEDLLVLLLDDLAGAMMRVDDVVADLEVDALGLSGDVQILDLRGSCLGDDALLRLGNGPCAGPVRFVSPRVGQVCR